MSNTRWEINNTSAGDDIVKKIELLLDRATQTVHSVEYTKTLVTIMMLMLIGIIILKSIKYFRQRR
jgi:hypothetical protein